MHLFFQYLGQGNIFFRFDMIYAYAQLSSVKKCVIVLAANGGVVECVEDVVDQQYYGVNRVMRRWFRLLFFLLNDGISNYSKFFNHMGWLKIWATSVETGQSHRKNKKKLLQIFHVYE